MREPAHRAFRLLYVFFTPPGCRRGAWREPGPSISAGGRAAPEGARPLGLGRQVGRSEGML
ncbi:hypothetical protein GCM10027161_48970 [Microbispora hainanensis]